ncbi:MAG: hypothetical protein NTX87_02450, partial [Planctomycetota bacterium]|nr:hypothetical protein [Planctomycetota bacterium]
MKVSKVAYLGARGGRRETVAWYVAVKVDGRWVRVKGFTDHAMTVELGRRVERLLAHKANREPPTEDLAAWIEGLPPELRARLAKIGALDARREAAARPLAEHLVDFRASLLARGCVQRYADLMAGRARRVVEGCKFKGVLDVDAGAVERYLAGLRADRVDPSGKVAKRGIGHQTHNFYVAAIQQFCRWLVDEGRAAASPVSRLGTLNVRTNRRHDRRALTVDELRRLLAAAGGGPERHGVGGPERAMLYRLAVETGL